MDYTIHKIKQEIIDLVAKAFGREIDKTKLDINVPPDRAMGDFAVPCFYLAKLSGHSPNIIADELSHKIHATGMIKLVQNNGPYINFFINPAVFAEEALGEILKNRADYGRLNLSEEKVMIEYSNPNTHKEFHIGHSRNAILGSSLVRLFKFTGRGVVPTNYIGDIGSHVAKCLWALEKFHKGEKLPENKGKFLGQVYTEASIKVEENPELKKEADEVLQKLENGDKKFTALWQKTRKWSIKELKDVYKLLDCGFDRIYYESEVEKPGKKIVEDLLAKGIAEKSEGAVVINLEKYNLKHFLLLKTDGSSLYSTKDLALAQLKFSEYKIDRSIVVVDSRQSFYLQQLFKTLEVMGFNKPMTHVAYEFVTLKEGVMSSRKGNIVLFEDFYAQVLARAEEETKKRHADWSEKKIKKTAEKITLSAIKFNMLRTGNNNVIVFDVEEALSFDGFSGPYIQYTCSRINSVLKKAGRAPKTADYTKLKEPIEAEIVLKLASFPETVAAAATLYQPSELTKYLFDLAKLFSNFYQTVPILNSDPKTKKARLALIGAIRQVLVNGLGLLGIEALSEM